MSDIFGKDWRNIETRTKVGICHLPGHYQTYAKGTDQEEHQSVEYEAKSKAKTIH